MPAMDWNPTHAVFLSLPPETAQVLPRGRMRWETTWTQTNSMEGIKTQDGGNGLLHAETTRLTQVWRIGLGEGLEAGIQIPFIYRSRPWMDGLIGWVEETAAGEMSATRRRYQGDSTTYEVNHPEFTVKDRVDQYGPGDIALIIKTLLVEETPHQPALAVRVGVELPTGSVTDGRGSGAVDVAVELGLQKALTSWLNAYGNVSATMPGNDSPYVRPFGGASFALELLPRENISLTAQYSTFSSPYQDTNVKVLDGRDDLVLMGVNYKYPLSKNRKLTFRLFAAENTFWRAPGEWAGSAADFTVGSGIFLE